jgi:trehalose 6-phosphate synthase
MYSKESVRKLVRYKLKGYKFMIVSNREPYLHMHTPEGIICSTPTGGLTAALDPLMQACGGIWVAGGSGDADRENVDSHGRCRVPPDKPKYMLKRVWMSKEEIDKFYFGFSNQTLWPLCHNVFQRPIFDGSFWSGYRHSNEMYAQAILEEIQQERKSFIWFHDYHLALAPKIVRGRISRGQEIVTAHFWHIPWPYFNTFMLCPWAKEILKGLLANDLIGFHLNADCVDFLSCVEKVLQIPVDYESSTIEYEKRRILVKPFPISIDFSAIDKLARRPKVTKEVEHIRSSDNIPYKFIGVGVDRLDYTKGIPERIHAIDRFLEKYPRYQGNFVFVEAGAPSREMIPTYRRLSEEIKELVDDVNWKYQRGYWKPIRYIHGKLDYTRLLALYRTADFCLVSPLQDGMNLVAKEYVAADVDLNGVLLLSKFAGATEELRDAIIVNPYDGEGLADAIKDALEMHKDEKRKRMERLRGSVGENNIYKWLSDFISEVAEVIVKE